MSAIYDVIVVGVGGVGSAACLELARRGQRVLGLDPHPIGHDRGSSHGRTRICRKAYFEHPDYVPLLHTAFDRWAQLEAERKECLFERCGMLLVGPPDGEVMVGVRRAVSEHGVQVHDMDADRMGREFPEFALPDGTEALFEPDAGFLHVESCVEAQAGRARELGAVLQTGERVTDWAASGGSVTVQTERGRYMAGALVVAGGAWSPALLRGLELPLEVRRTVQLFYRVTDTGPSLRRGAPVFAYDLGERFVYGFPALADGMLKAAEHAGGDRVPDPDRLDREYRPEDGGYVSGFIREHLRGVDPAVVAHAACMYTMTPDQHFVLDQHPEHGNVVFAAGLSGHGFKFVPALAACLVDLALEGRTAHPIEFLRRRW